jgi:hypothetical protein
MENLIFAICYTAIIAVIAFYYWIEGNKKGVNETIQIIMQLEPEALMRIKPKLKELLNGPADAE